MLPYHYYFIMLMAGLTLFLLQGRRQFDELLRALHAEHRALWEAQGRPMGFFWQPETDSPSWAEGTRARTACFWAWMRATPAVLQDKPALRRHLWWSRLNILLSYVGFFLSGLALIYLHFFPV